MKENINEHDMTKKMMDVIRGGYRTKLITEAEDQTALDAQKADADAEFAEEDKDTKTYEKGTPEYNSEYEKMADIVDPSVNIEFFKVNPKTRKAELSGTILNGKGKFTMDMASDEVQLDTTLIGLNDTNSEIMKKLQGYFKNWKDETAKSINKGDFNQKQENEF